MIICPKYNWNKYKSIDQGPWSFFIPDNKNVKTSFFIERNTEYRCFNEEIVEFRTDRTLFHNISRQTNYYSFFGTIYETCDQECDSRNENISMFYRDREWVERREWSEWSNSKQLGKFVYVNKNCDKLYWTSWIEISNCSIFDNSIHIRQCVDCDKDLINSKYCVGNQLKNNSCHHRWSEWTVMGACNVIGCKLTGEQVRKRVCLYGDDRETANVELCRSNSNKSDVMVEQCNILKLPISCQPHWNEWSEAGPCITSGCNTTGRQARSRKCLYGDGSEAPDIQLCSNISSELRLEACINTNLSSNCPLSFSTTSTFTGLYVGIGVAVALTFVLFIVIVAFKHFRRKTGQSLSNNVTNRENQNISDYEIVTESASTRQKRNTAERIQVTESNVRFQTKKSLSNVYEVEQQEGSEIYEQVMANASESIISPNNENQQSLKKCLHLYYTVQEPGVQTEQTNVYSSLEKPNDHEESDYSSLDPR